MGSQVRPMVGNQLGSAFVGVIWPGDPDVGYCQHALARDLSGNQTRHQCYSSCVPMNINELK